MHVKKSGRLGAVLAIAAVVILLICTYLTLLPGQLLLPPGLGFGVYAVEGPGWRTGSAAVVMHNEEPAPGDLVVWEDGGWKVDRVVTAGEEGWIEAGTQMTVIEPKSAEGCVRYEIYALGACIDALSWAPGCYIVWAADVLYLLGWGIWMITLPGRTRRRRKAELIRRFEHYGAKYDLEDEGVDY